MNTYEQVGNCLEKLHVIQMDNITIDTVGEKMIAYCTWWPEERVMKNLEELSWMTFFSPVIVIND